MRTVSVDTRADVVLVDGSPAFIGDVRRRFAADDGPIVPVIEQSASDVRAAEARRGYDCERLLVERVVTVNTTASGGNAELLAIAS